jgi:hypothetical protein
MVALARDLEGHAPPLSKHVELGSSTRLDSLPAGFASV